MDALFTILLIALALSAIVATMYVVLREKREHDAHTRYVRSPWAEDSGVAEAAEEEETDAESLVQPLVVPDETHVAHTPLTEGITPADEEEERR